MSDEDDLRTRVDELERTLAALREQLDDDRRATRRSINRRRRPRPPSPGELLRFTESHTIPTLVATLEATIQALELAGGLLRLLDPATPDDSARDVPPGARATVRSALSNLQSALDETDLPDDPAARDLVADARSLAAEVESRLDDAGRRPDRTGDEGVAVDVREEGASEGESSDGDDASVDVESELDSIRDELRGDEE